MRLLGVVRVVGVLLFLLILSFTSELRAQTLSERSLYERCHAKLVRETPHPADPLIPMIEAGTITGAQACSQLAQLPKLSTTGEIPPYTSDPWRQAQSRKVLSSMNDFHTSWFAVKEFNYGFTCLDVVTKSVIDGLQPAYYMTRALYGNSDISSALRGTVPPRAIRSVDNPTRSIYSGLVNNTTPVVSGFAGAKIVPNGILLGFSDEQDQVAPMLRAMTRAPGETSTRTEANAHVLRGLGGGLLGSPAYLNNNFGDQGDLIFDLAKMPRTWSKWIFKDLLCRDLPVISAADAQGLTACASGCGITPPAAELPRVLTFRQGVSCTQCHASIDQIGGVLRGFRNFRTGTVCRFVEPQEHDAIVVRPTAPSLPTNTVWKYVADANYHKEPSYGRFYYRNYRNVLMNVPVTSLEQLGATIAATDDFYICAAKRYYHYFTGIDVDLSPITQAEVDALPSDQKFFRKRVENLGLQLKGTTFNKDPLRLIQAIFALPEYKKRDMNLREEASK